jgi:Cellulose biosynthesis protein BcsS
MGCGRRVRAAAATAAAFLVGFVSAAPARAGGDGPRWLFFSGGDFWANGQFAHGGLLWSPAGFDSAGLVLKAMASAGFYRYRSGALADALVRGIDASAQLLPGWRFKYERLQITLYAGLDLQEDITWPFDLSNRLHGFSIGARGAAEFWFEPTPNTMLAADGFLSSIATAYSARIAYGWRFVGDFFLGPEVQAFSCNDYRQYRVGLHLTALKTGAVEWSAALGWSEDSDGRASPYFRIGILTRR